MALTKIDDRGLKTPVDLLDNEKIRFGTGNDLEVYHDGTNSTVDNKTGDLYIKSISDVFITPGTTEAGAYIRHNGAAELYYDNSKKLETTSVGMRLSGNYQANDGYHIYLGTGNDLDLYHDGSHSYIHSDNGELKNRAAIWKVVNEANSEVQIKATENGSVELYYDNSKKLATSASGVEIENGDLRIHLDAKILNDNRKLYFGAGNDLQIYHDGSTNIIDGQYHPIELRHQSEVHIKCVDDGTVELYHNNSKKFETTSDGAQVTGLIKVGTNASEYANNYLRFKSGGDAYIDHNTTSQDIIFRVSNNSSLDTIPLKLYNDGTVNIGQGINDAKLRFGAGSEFQIWNNGTTAAHIHNIDGDINISCESGHKVVIQNGTAGNHLAEFNYGDSVELFYNGSRKFETNSTGVVVTGGIYLDGSGGEAAANKMDDYEEGTWTVTFLYYNSGYYGTSWTTAPGNTTGKYIKIGKLVFFQVYVSNWDMNGGQDNSAAISGLPFTTASTNNFAVCNYVHGNAFNESGTNGGYIDSGSDKILFIQEGSTTMATWHASSGRYAMWSGCYQAA